MTNKKQPIVPVFRGERYHGELIQGLYFLGRIEQTYIELQDGHVHAVKPETLQMSLDGENWHSMEEVRDALEFKAEYDKKCIIDPSTWHQGFNVSYECPHCRALVYDHRRVETCDQCKKGLDWSEIEKEC